MTRALPLDGPVAVTLPAGGNAWLYADVEAARAGRSVARVEFEAQVGRQSVSGAYEVLAGARRGYRRVGPED